jgi:branched-chain amino acid transport system substrate-binding protein
MKQLKKLAIAASLAAALAGGLAAPQAFAQAKEQYFPVLVYRTGAYAPNGVPWANGFIDYLKLVNAKGGINGVKISSRSAKPVTPPTAVSNATSA